MPAPRIACTGTGHRTEFRGHNEGSLRAPANDKVAPGHRPAHGVSNPSMPDPFRPCSTEHLATALIGSTCVILILVLGRCGGRTQRGTSRILALVNFAAPFASLLIAGLNGSLEDPEAVFPFHLCDLAAIAAGIALLTQRTLFCAMTYFWGLAGTLQGLLTPALGWGFPAPTCMVFFVQHFAVVAAALYLPLVLGWRPRQPLWKAVGEIYLWSLGYLGFALGMNALTRGNFAYASHPPANPSLLDHLGPWPWYLLSMLGVALVLFILLALPFARFRNPKQCPPNENPTTN